MKCLLASLANARELKWFLEIAPKPTLKEVHSDLHSAIELAQQFAVLVRQRLPEQLDAWLKKAKNSSVSLLHSFALGLESDYNAVKGGVTLWTSNSPVEGQINRLKMFKRQMFGRAGLDLLT